MKPTLEQLFSYFRLCLATGLVRPAEVIAWADRQILAWEGALPHALIELSLASSQPLSQLVGLLYDFQSFPGDELPLEMVLARASVLLDGGMASADLLREVSLLLAENKLPPGLKSKLTQLSAGREALDRVGDGERELHNLLASFLVSYRDARACLPELE